uniref:Photosynthetic NDH subcomplex B 4 n=1 Tax=Apostasia odorata TaxID=280455 RepID=A0A0F7GXY6_9ASPA|nr:hypothetical protein [Apostasia odorata]
MEAAKSFSAPRSHLRKIDFNSFTRAPIKVQDASWSTNRTRRSRGSGSPWKVSALPEWPLMAVMVEHVPFSRDWVVHKSVWHLSDEAIKTVYAIYIMFTCWGCCFFGSMKDPFYDGEKYRSDGGDGSVYWFYEKQEDIEEQARAEMWREELIEEIEQKVGGLRELEDAGKEEEQLVK